MHRSDIILQVQEDKLHLEDRWEGDRGVSEQQQKLYPCRIAVAPVQHRLLNPRIVMIGGFQECYKIRVTEELVDAVTYGAFSQVPPMMSLPFLAHIIA